MIAYLIGLAIFCDYYHGGQASRLYRVGCLARRYLLQWYQIRDPHEWITAPYIKGSYQVAAWQHYHTLRERYVDEV